MGREPPFTHRSPVLCNILLNLELLRSIHVLVVVAYLVDVLHDDDVDAGVVDGAAAGDEHGVVDGLVVAVGVGAHHALLSLFLVDVLALFADDDEVLRLVVPRSLHGGAVILPRQRDDGGGTTVVGEAGGEVVVDLVHGGVHLGVVVGCHILC
jgi:hypothetical protein